jgi:hypothetical protein
MDGNEEQKKTDELFLESDADPEKIAASMFMIYLPRFKGIVDNLSNKALRRVLKALVEYPLVDENHNLTTNLEKEALFISEKLILSKMMLIQHTMLNQPELLQQSENSDIVVGETKNEEKEVNNG